MVFETSQKHFFAFLQWGFNKNSIHQKKERKGNSGDTIKISFLRETLGFLFKINKYISIVMCDNKSLFDYTKVFRTVDKIRSSFTKT